MSGLVSGDPAIARAMDCGMKGWSAIIPVYMKADETISEKQSKTATFQEVEKLKRHILTTVRKIGAEIKNGTVDIRPVRNKNYMPCDYCKYITVCGYDPTVHPCRKPQEFDSDAEIWEAME